MRHLHHALVLAAILIAAVPAAADDGEISRATLKGLEGVRVLVEDFSDKARDAGYSKTTFQTDVELKLRLAGIKVLTFEERWAAPGKPRLYLVVHPVSPMSSADGVPYSISLQVSQWVTLATGKKTNAATWLISEVGHGGLPFIRDSAKDNVDQFINAWLSVNPKP